LDPRAVETNMVFFDCPRTGRTGAELAQRMAKEGVLMHATGPHRIRLVTHLGVSREQIVQAVQAFKNVLMLV
ncbi:MAG: low specificity L-threonine aldolase, partial [Planctomycetota bacterium]